LYFGTMLRVISFQLKGYRFANFVESFLVFILVEKQFLTKAL